MKKRSVAKKLERFKHQLNEVMNEIDEINMKIEELIDTLEEEDDKEASSDSPFDEYY